MRGDLTRPEAPEAGRGPRRDLLAATARFCRVLRARGVGVTTAGVQDAVRTLALVDLGDREEVRQALRTVLVARREELVVFDTAFEAFWGPGPSTVAATAVAAGAEEPRLPGAGQGAGEFAGWVARGEGEGEPVGLPGVSDLESLRGRDFSTLDAGELEQVERVAREIARRLATCRSRRFHPTRRRGRVDLRRTLRRNLTRGELVELARRARRVLKPRVVLLCDVSGSMDLYSRLLVTFLYAMQNQLGRIETFVFSTRLVRVTEELSGQSFARALDRLGGIRGWSGGTRIGESLRAFWQEWRHLLDRDTVVLILSDGWDTGEPAVLSEALVAIRRRAARVIWLNPLLGSPDYEPLTQGMVAALPHVDAFLPAHNLDALRALARHLRP